MPCAAIISAAWSSAVGRVGFGLLGESAQVIDHRVEIPGGRGGLAG